MEGNKSVVKVWYKLCNISTYTRFDEMDIEETKPRDMLRLIEGTPFATKYSVKQHLSSLVNNSHDGTA